MIKRMHLGVAKCQVIQEKLNTLGTEDSVK
jgi:hypothetical protein